MIAWLKALFKRKPKAPPAPRYCVDCTHFRPDTAFWRTGTGSCWHPRNWKRDPVTGGKESVWRDAAAAREPFSLCGPKGFYWIAKEEK